MRHCQGSAAGRTAVLGISVLLCALSVVSARAEDGKGISVAPPFTARVLADGLDFPWEMLWGPDGRLWVTERHGLKITQIDPKTGEKLVIGEIPEAFPGPQHEGVLGMAFHSGFLDSPSDNFVYVYYTMKKGDDRHGRLARFAYDPAARKLSDQKVLLDNTPAGDDHNAGRVLFGPDGKLYLSIGEQGHNQGANFCLPIEAQRLPTRAEVDAKDWDAYRGKVLRINPDGSVPADNPVLGGVKSHVYTYGHRNPQGLAFVGKLLFESEHGPSSDDELNLLEPGANYGWPHVAGFRDDQGYVYANYSAAPNCGKLAYDPNVIPGGVPVQRETQWWADNYREPIKTFWTVRDDHDFHDPRCFPDHTYLCYPTIAPSDIIHYPADGAIPQFRKSILMTTLKTGALVRVQLNDDETQVQGDATKYFRTRNRYRAVAIDPEGKNVFVATDVSGGAIDVDGNAVKAMRDPGSILVFTYEPEEDE